MDQSVNLKIIYGSGSFLGIFERSYRNGKLSKNRIIVAGKNVQSQMNSVHFSTFGTGHFYESKNFFNFCF